MISQDVTKDGGKNQLLIMIDWVIVNCIAFGSRIFDAYRDKTIADEELKNWGFCSVPSLSRQICCIGTFVYTVSIEGPSCLVASYNKLGEVSFFVTRIPGANKQFIL